VKIWIIFLSFLVLILSTVPCTALPSASKCSIEKECESTSHECGSNCKGKCSPFYSCGGCIGFTMMSSSSLITEKTLIISDKMVKAITYDKFVHSSFICKIWQPPKIY
jgi:hypothetical protein